MTVRNTNSLGWQIRNHLLVTEFYGDPQQMKEDRPWLYFKWLWSGWLVNLLRVIAVVSIVVGLIIINSSSGFNLVPFLLFTGGIVAVAMAIKWRKRTAYREFLSKVCFIGGVPAVIAGFIMMAMSNGLTALPWLFMTTAISGALWVASTKLETRRRNGPNPRNYHEF